MAVDLRLSRAFIDGSDSIEYSTYRILGWKLRKFCLWHRLLLRTIESPFEVGGAVTMKDIRILVGVCCLPYGNSIVRKPHLMPFLIYAWAFARAIFSRKSEISPLKTSTEKLCAAIKEYAGEYLHAPEFCVVPPDQKTSKGRKSNRSRAPEDIEQVADLIAWTHWSLKTIWELPIGQVNWLRVFAMRSVGNDIDFVTEDERKFMLQLPDEYRSR